MNTGLELDLLFQAIRN